MRRLLVLVAGLSLAAALLALAPTSSSWADDDNGPASADEDAGPSPSAVPAVPAPAPGAETTTAVGNEVQYRAALAALTVDPAGPHVIEITASFTVDDGTDPVYNNPTEALTIDGNGFTVTSAGGSDQRFLDADANVDLTINALTVTGFESQSSGGAISTDGAVTVVNSTFSGNTADGDGGAIDSEGDAVLTSSSFVGNTANDGGDGGAVDTSNDDTTIVATDSTFTDNSADSSGGALSTEGDTAAVGSTFSGNQSEEGAAIGSYGSVTMTNSTVTGNTGDFDVIDGSGDETGVGDVTLVHVTIAENTVVAATEGVIDSDEDGVLTLFATTVSGTSGNGVNCETGDFSSVVSSYSRSDDASCGLTGTGDIEGAGDPGLGTLTDNGGPTQTMLPESGSPLIDAIPAADCDAAVATDQRGVGRPQDGDDDGTPACDIGAVEVEGVVEPPPVDPGPVPAAPPFTG